VLLIVVVDCQLSIDSIFCDRLLNDFDPYNNNYYYEAVDMSVK